MPSFEASLLKGTMRRAAPPAPEPQDNVRPRPALSDIPSVLWKTYFQRGGGEGGVIFFYGKVVCGLVLMLGVCRDSLVLGSC